MPKDPQKQREAKQRWYAKNRQVYFDRNIKRRDTCKEVLLEVKGAPCLDCGVVYPHYVMDFDHRDGATKKSDVSRLARDGMLEAMLEEIGKCDLVCANCHRIRTHERRSRVV